MRIAIIAIGMVVASCATAPPPVPAVNATIPLNHLPALEGSYFAVDSREAGHRYHIYVRYPDGYDPTLERRYPAVYVLDGDSLFPVLAPTQLFLHYDDQMPEALVIGIAYGSFDPPQNRRRHDFTVGADDFSRFLERELIPRVEQTFRADPRRRILFGQSRGGGFALHSAFTRPDLFWARVASNPTLDELPALTAAPRAASRPDLRLFVASGEADRPQYREPLLRWFRTWRDRQGLPWLLRTDTIPGGTHAADAGRVYRQAMRWLFTESPAPGQ